MLPPTEIYIMFALLADYRIAVERHTAKGRMDITLETDNTIYVMELKFGKSAEEALAQIASKRYEKASAQKDKRAVRVGLNFAVKDEVNVLKWVVE